MVQKGKYPWVTYWSLLRFQNQHTTSEHHNICEDARIVILAKYIIMAKICIAGRRLWSQHGWHNMHPIVATMRSRSLRVLKRPSICTYGRNMAYWSAYLSNMAHIVAMYGYMGIFGPWRLPNQNGANVFY